MPTLTQALFTLPKPNVVQCTWYILRLSVDGRLTFCQVLAGFFDWWTPFFVESIELKSSLTDPPISRGFAIGDVTYNEDARAEIQRLLTFIKRNQYFVS